jgi:putative FmdB family regulatory protein
MPTYDYECNACGHKFELFQGINDPIQKKCPQCKKLKLRRLFGTGAAIMFKGSGFYQTDYRSESYKKGATADSSKNGDSASKGADSSSKSESAGAKSDGPGKPDGAGKSDGASKGESSGSKPSKKTKGADK